MRCDCVKKLKREIERLQKYEREHVDWEVTIRGNGMYPFDLIRSLEHALDICSNEMTVSSV